MPPGPEPTVSVIIPAYNEAHRLAAGYARLASVLPSLGADVEVVIVDDGSSDATAEAAADIYGALDPVVVRHPHNRGKGAAVATGIARARGARLLVVDADMAIDPEHYPALVAGLDHADVVAGSRAAAGTIRYASRARTWAGWAFHLLVRHYTGVRLADTQCGAKALRRGPARLLALLGTIDGFAYDAEYLHLAARLGLRVVAYPVTWRDVGGSTVRLSRAPLAMLADLRRLRSTAYQLPGVVVTAPAPASLGAILRHHGAQGAVIAHGADDDLVVVGRHDAPAAAALAADVGGTLGAIGLTELVGREVAALD